MAGEHKHKDGMYQSANALLGRVEKAWESSKADHKILHWLSVGVGWVLAFIGFRDVWNFLQDRWFVAIFIIMSVAVAWFFLMDFYKSKRVKSDFPLAAWGLVLVMFGTHYYHANALRSENDGLKRELSRTNLYFTNLLFRTNAYYAQVESTNIVLQQKAAEFAKIWNDYSHADHLCYWMYTVAFDDYTNELYLPATKYPECVRWYENAHLLEREYHKTLEQGLVTWPIYAAACFKTNNGFAASSQLQSNLNWMLCQSIDKDGLMDNLHCLTTIRNTMPTNTWPIIDNAYNTVLAEWEKSQKLP